MPYYTKAMVNYMKEQEQAKMTDNKIAINKVDKSVKSGGANKPNEGNLITEVNAGAQDKCQSQRVVRVTPSSVDPDASSAFSRYQCVQSQKGLTFDDKRLLYMKNLLRIQVEKIQHIEAASPPVDESGRGRNLATYVYDEKKPYRVGKKRTIFQGKHPKHPTEPIIIVVYDDLDKVVPNAFYLKILRHLGKKHPYIVQTWDIFVDSKKRTIIVQEFADKSDLGKYLAKNSKESPIDEQQSCVWALQLFKALDYLGDMGVCHRNLRPRRVLLTRPELSIRLAGLFDAVIYWNVKTEDILNFPCIPVAKRSRTSPDFQAPEVYGNTAKEEFDPVSADVWSYGAIVYYMTTQSYPYDYKKENAELEKEIQKNIKKMNLSEEGKSLLGALLDTNAMARLTFDRIGNHKWFSKFNRKDWVVGSTKQ